MDFFQSQDHARRKTSLLVIYFVLAVVLIVAAIYAAIVAILLWGGAPRETALDWVILGWVVLGTLTVVMAGSLYKVAALRAGGESIARMLGGRPISPDTSDPDERRLLNIVEEMAIASGTPVLPVFAIPEDAINAFAAGFSPTDAVIGVTRGCMRRLNRDQLQGVIAHEFSHILNGDMRLNIRLMGVLHGILVIAIVGYTLMRTTAHVSRGRSSGGSKKGGNPLPLFGLALMVIGYIGVFFGKLIKSAVSRQREFLADAASVQFTRNPDGIAGALKVIGGFSPGSRVRHTNAEAASHMFFANGLRQSFMGLMATHPPLKERIRRIDPNFDGQFVETATEAAPDAAPPGTSPLTAAAPAPPPPLPTEYSAARLVDQVGNPGPEHVAFAGALLAGMPEALSASIRSAFGARAVVYALLLDDAVLAKQRTRLEEKAEPRVAQLALELRESVASLPRQARLPLVDIAIPALRTLSPRQYVTFRETMTFLIEADDQIDLFEYALQRLVVRHLDPQFGRGVRHAAANASMRDVLDAATDLVSTLAYYGHDDETAAREAFETGFARLQSGAHRTIRPLTDCNLALADSALTRIDNALPFVKKRVIEACVTAVARDGKTTVEESELLRAIADALGCPMPPLLAPSIMETQRAV